MVLRLAMNNSGMVKRDSEWKKYDEYALKWDPYKSIAALHLWKTVLSSNFFKNS